VARGLAAFGRTRAQANILRARTATVMFCGTRKTAVMLILVLDSAMFGFSVVLFVRLSRTQEATERGPAKWLAPHILCTG
jgi:hypothetical protein